MSQAERIVVAGAGLAGLRSAERLRELGFEGELVIIGAESLPPYHRPALSKQLLTGAMRPNDLMLPAYQEIGAKWRLGTTARWLSTHNRVLHLPGKEELSYDGLIIATGVEAVRPNNVPYHDQRIMVMRTLPDALNLERAIAANRGPVAVVGGGFTGCEIAASLRHMGREVTLIGRSPSLLGSVLGPKLGDWLTGLHRDHGVDLALGTSVVDWQPNPDGIGLYLSDGTSLLAACVVIAAGTTPSTGWLRGSGLPLDNGVVCDPTCHVVGANDVVAAGDVAQWPNLRFDTVPRRIEHWLNAVEMGRAAAESLWAGRAAAQPFTPMPRFWTEQYGVRLQAAGVPKLGTDTITLGTVEDGTGTLVGYVQEGRLVGVVGVDCPSSVLAWTETIRQQNPSAWDPTPALDPPTGPRHSLPAKPKRTRAKSPTHSRLTPTDPAPSSSRLVAPQTNSRLNPASNPRLRPADPAPSSSRFGAPQTSGRLNPASNPRMRPADPSAFPASSSRLRPADPASSSARFGAPQTNGRLNPASEPRMRPVDPAASARYPAPQTNGHLNPASNSRLRPAEPSAFPASSSRLRPTDPIRSNGRPPTNGHSASEPRMRPVDPAASARYPAPQTNGHLDPIRSNGRPPTNGHPASEPRMRPVDPAASARYPAPPTNGHLDPIRSNGRPPTNGHPASEPRMRPVDPGSLPSAASSGRFPPAQTNGQRIPIPPERNGHGPVNGYARPAESNGHQGPTNGYSGRAESNGRPVNGYARPEGTNGHRGATNGSGGGMRVPEIDGRYGLGGGALRAMDIHGRFAGLDVTGQMEPVGVDVTGWIPRVDARRARAGE